MRTEYKITVREFPVKVKDERTGDIYQDTVVLSKEMLNGAQLVGQSSKELIHRLYNRGGIRVLDIGKPLKETIVIPLDRLILFVRGEL